MDGTKEQIAKLVQEAIVNLTKNIEQVNGGVPGSVEVQELSTLETGIRVRTHNRGTRYFGIRFKEYI